MAVPNQKSQGPLPPEEREKLKEKVINQVRAVLLPEKHGMLLDNLNNEYKSIIGESIPWKKLGYSTFDEFVQTNRQLFKLEKKTDGYIWVHAVPTEETQHIRNLVSMQKSKKRSSAKPKPARRPLNTEKWSPPSPGNPISGMPSSQHAQGRQVANGRFNNGNGLSQVSGNRMSGVQYNRRFPQSGGSGRFASGGNVSANMGKGDYTRPFLNQAQKLRTPNMGYNMNQNNQQSIRNFKQQSGSMPQYLANNSNKRNGAPNYNIHNNPSMNSAPGRQGMPQNKPMNGNQISNKSFPSNYNNNNAHRNVNSSTMNNSRGYSDQYKPLLQEYFNKNNLGSLEYKTATLETKVSGPNNNQGAKNFKTSKLMKRFISTVKVHDKNYQTFPQDFATSDAAEEAAAKLACIQLNINKVSLGNANDSSSSKSIKRANQPSINHTPSVGTTSNSVTNDTDFGDWIPPPTDTSGVTSVGKDKEELYMIKYIDRIIQLVGKRSNGVWSTQIDVEYSQTFHERLPDNWTEDIEKLEYGQKRLRMDRPIPGRCIILPNLEFNLSEEVSKSTPTQTDTLNSIVTTQPETKEKNPKVKAPTSFEDKSASHPRTSQEVNTKSVPSPGYDIQSQNKPPSLFMPEEELWDVYVTHVHSTMNVCLRLLGDEYSAKFDDLVTNMELHYFNAETMPSVLVPTVGKLYAAKVDGEWHRVEVTNVRGIDVSCYFIDHGDEDNLKAADLKELQDDFLKLAPQAKHVRLAGLEDFRDSSSAIANLTSMVLGRSLVGNVHTNDNDGVSLVLWDTSGDNEDININESLLMKMKEDHIHGGETTSQHSSMPSLDSSPNGKLDLKITDSKQANAIQNSKIIKQTDVKSTTNLARNASNIQEETFDTDVKELMSMDISSFAPLTRAVLPDADDFFDVTVTLAGSPSNFSVQPYFEGRALENLSLEMNKFYNDEKNHYDKGPLTSDHLSKDFFFAGKHDDGQWYRVKVNSMLDEYSAAVKLVDYGDYSMMQLENMQPLWPQFRHLSMQAISASLAGIIATHGDWTPDDAVWFAQRVVNKQFVSKIKDVIWDMNDHDACGNGFKLSLSLFDTSNPNEDVVIEKLLVDAGKAVYLCV